MIINRREFVTGLAAAGLAATSVRLSLAQESQSAINCVVFWEEGFPSVDGMNLTKTAIQRALGGIRAVFATSTELEAVLAKGVDVFVNPYGSAFPRGAWTTILTYLQRGGNFINLGGRPFSVPVGQDGIARAAQTSYHKRLGITQYFPVEGEKNEDYITADPSFPFTTAPVRIFEGYYKFTTVNDFPEDSGSDGRREATITSLVIGRKNTESDDRLIPYSAPVVRIERLQGEFAGGRWVLANYTGDIDGATVLAMVKDAAIGAIEIKADAFYATFRTKERVPVTIKATKGAKPLVLKAVKMSVTNPEGGVPVETGLEKIDGYGSVVFEPMQKGFYSGSMTGEAEVSPGTSVKFSVPVGFWVTDDEPIEGGEQLVPDRHFLTRNGLPYVCTGTTYMSSSVARRFLLEPNAAEWDRDFQAMKEAGVNMVRTGIWTGWKLHVNEKGEVKPEVLRAFEAFLLTAAKYDMPVIFTFFAFMPEFFGGKNAYLDPKSVEGQKKFVSAFAERARAVDDVIWDLINEPSFANPKQLWSCRPNYDEFEKAAWKKWLHKRFGEADEARLAAILRDKWRLREDEDAFALPTNRDFDNINIHVERRPMRAMDFRFFAQDTFTAWAAEMRKTLRGAGNDVQLVMVGQDEAGTGDSPAPQFHAEALDLTALHNWWANDELVWDSVMTKTPNKPNLVQETGVMFYEKQDGSAWRSESLAADLLERKMAMSLGVSGAGFIQWIWNVNPFMDNENESAIGFFRPDGTAKEEFQRFMDMSLLVTNQMSNFIGKEDEEILLVIPQSQLFSPRNLTTEATKKAVRALHYHLRQPCMAVGEYQLGSIDSRTVVPKLVIVPSPRILSTEAWKIIVDLCEKGAHVLISGFFEEDRYFLPAPRIGSAIQVDGPVPVQSVETLTIGEDDYPVRFSGDKQQRVEKAVSPHSGVVKLARFDNRMMWLPVPIENGDTLDAVIAFYQMGLKAAGIKASFSIEGADESVLVRRTVFKDWVLYTIVNEGNRDLDLKLAQMPNLKPVDISVQAGRTRLIFLDRKTGKAKN